MKEEKKQAIVAMAKEWIGLNQSHSAAKLSVKAGFSTATLSAILNGKWEKISDQLWNKLDFTLKSNPDHLDTNNFNMVVGCCVRAKREKIRLGINGYSGAGKSYALKEFARNNADVFLVTIRNRTSERTLLEQIATLVGVPTTGRSYHIQDAIVERLSGKDCLLIFDECEYLKNTSWDCVKSICDLLENQCGIIISGLGIRNKIRTGMLRNINGMEQLHRRFSNKWCEMLALEYKEITEICELFDITDKGALTWFTDRCKNYDSLLMCIKDVVKAAEMQGCNKDLDLIKKLDLE